MEIATNNIYQILAVDDEPGVRRALKLLLQHAGHNVQTAEGGEAALALYEPGHFDLVITDYAMPAMKGDELAALIKQRQPCQPIIMATASAYDLQINGKPNAVDCFLEKPFSLAALQEAINTVMLNQNAFVGELTPPLHLSDLRTAHR